MKSKNKSNRWISNCTLTVNKSIFLFDNGFFLIQKAVNMQRLLRISNALFLSPGFTIILWRGQLSVNIFPRSKLTGNGVNIPEGFDSWPPRPIRVDIQKLNLAFLLGYLTTVEALDIGSVQWLNVLK